MGLFRRRPGGSRASSPVDLGVPRTIDLVDTPPTGDKQWGLPTHCPKCANPGYLDSIDMNRRVMHQHCPKCWHKWTTTEAEIRSGSAK